MITVAGPSAQLKPDSAVSNVAGPSAQLEPDFTTSSDQPEAKKQKQSAGKRLVDVSNREGYVKKMKDAAEAMMAAAHGTQSGLPPHLVREATSKIDQDWSEYSTAACQHLVKFVDSRVRELFVLGGTGTTGSAFVIMMVLMTHL